MSLLVPRVTEGESLVLRQAPRYTGLGAPQLSCFVLCRYACKGLLLRRGEGVEQSGSKAYGREQRSVDEESLPRLKPLLSLS